MNLFDECKQRIETALGYEKFFGAFVELHLASDEEARFACIAHSDSNPSASVNLATGLWTCFNPECGAKGDAVDFYCYAHRLGGNRKEGVRRLAADLGLLVSISAEEIETMHRRLFDREELLVAAERMFGVKRATLERFKVGFHDKAGADGRLTIPIPGEDGSYVDVRRYNAGFSPKILHWKSGTGSARIFPIQALYQNETVVLFEGEKDALRAQEFGIAGAITVTGAAGTLPENYAELFQGKTVYLCFDVDAAGEKGAEKVAKKLCRCAAALFRIDLPKEGLPANGDFSDWANLRRTWEEWQALVEAAVAIPIQRPESGEARQAAANVTASERSDPSDSADTLTVEFGGLNDPALFGRRLRFMAHMIGASVGLKEFQAPAEIQVSCSRHFKECASCVINGLNPAEMPHPFRFDLAKEDSLDLIRVSKKQRTGALKHFCGIPDTCPKVRFEEIGRQPVQQLLLSPPTELARMHSSGAGFRIAFYHGPPITDNRDYWFEGFLQADPKTQETVLNLVRAEPARNALDGFAIDRGVREAVNAFVKRADRSVAQHFEAIHKVVENDIGIYGRHDVQHAVLEAVFSVLEFQIGEKRIENGWNEILIVGDTRTGKSVAVKHMMEMLDLGEFVSCENVSAAGLIGGIEWIEKVPVPVWGIWPRNDGGFLALDEADELTEGERNLIGQLSAMRSSGKAEIQKIAHASTSAKVRTLWITNPRGGTKISSYNGGCKAIGEIIKSRQDVARFVKAYAISTDDVTIETITDIRARVQDETVRGYWNKLAILTWSLAPDQVSFTAAAQGYLKAQARQIVEEYHDAIPLIEKGSALDKLAKLSVPVAALCGSFREQEDGRLTLVIEPEHAEYALAHLRQTYDGQALGYRQFSRLEFERGRVRNPGEIRSRFEGCAGASFHTLVNYFLSNNWFSRRGFDELLGVDGVAKSIWGALLQHNCLQMTASGNAVKTPAFATLLQEWMREAETPKGAEKA